MKPLVEQWVQPYRALKKVHSDEDIHIGSNTGWYKRMLDGRNTQVTLGVPYTQTSNPLCETKNCVVEQNLTILMKQEPTKDCVRLLPRIVLTMNSQRNFSTGYTPPEPFHCRRPAWFSKNLYLRNT